MTDNPKAFKHNLGRDAIRCIARNIQRAQPSFSERAFARTANRGLDELELKARVQHIVGALRTHLPDDEVDAIGVLVRARRGWNNAGAATYGFAAWPIIEFVGAFGLGHFDVSMAALREMTGLFSAEFAIRGFIERYPARAHELLTQWTGDPDEHVRRLVSEGTRPRLPWGRRLQQFQRDPRPVLALLDALKDDPAEYVRRSVANNLNDIAKDHPEAVIEVCRRWAKKASAERQWIIRRATRTLVKQGRPEALELLGFDPAAKVAVEAFTLARKRITVGEVLPFTIEIRSRSSRTQALAIDYAVHHVKQSGKRTAKVFKLKTLELAGRATVTLSKKHSFRPITTRTYHAGRHALEILINGESHATREFDLKT